MPYDFFSDKAFEAEKQKLYEGMKEVLSDDKGLGTPQNFIDIYRNNYLYGTCLLYTSPSRPSAKS